MSDFLRLLPKGCALLLLGLWGCSPVPTREWKRMEAMEPLVVKSPFGGKEKQLFKGKVDFYDKYFSGILVVKPVEEAYRVALVTEVGMTIFDMLVHADGVEKKFCLKVMDRPLIVNQLKKDLQLMFFPESQSSLRFKKAWVSRTESERQAWKVKAKAFRGMAFFGQDSRLERVQRRNCLGKAQEMEMTYDENGRFQGLTLTHRRVKLRLRFERL